MVAPAGIYAEAAVDAAQQGGYFIRLAHGGILVVKNIARQHHHVRLRLINLLHHALHLRRTHIITKMQIGHKGNAQLTLLRGSARLVHRDRLFAQHHALRMQNPPCADACHKQNGKPAHCSEHAPRMAQPARTPFCVLPYQAGGVQRQHSEQDIGQRAQPVITQQLQKAVRRALCDKKPRKGRK